MLDSLMATTLYSKRPHAAYFGISLFMLLYNNNNDVMFHLRFI